MSPQNLDEFFRLGEKADQYYAGGFYREAHKCYAEILEKVEGAGAMDSYLIAKVTLGLLLTHIKSGDFERAYAIWNANIEESLFGIGIYALENAQTTVDDMLIYDFICAYLHSLSNGPKEDSAKAVNQYMSRICEHALDTGDRKLLRMALSNWKQHLGEIFRGSFPQHIAAPLIRFERKLGETVRLQPLEFPQPTEWHKPEGFREMSRIGDFRALRFEPEAGGNTARKIKDE